MSDDDSNLAAVRHARELFLKHIEQEKDPVKQEKLREFIPHIEKTFSLHEIDWFRMKAIETADAARIFVDSQKSEQDSRNFTRVFRLRLLASLWVIFLIASPVVIWTGMQKVYVYKTPEGSEMTSQMYEGEMIISGENQIKLEFNRKEWALMRQPVQRVTGVVLAFFGLIALTLGKTEILK